jgi:hypothetical protein
MSTAKPSLLSVTFHQNGTSPGYMWISGYVAGFGPLSTIAVTVDGQLLAKGLVRCVLPPE